MARQRRTAEIDVGDTLESLIDQFTDPYAFLRELVQNALDAGTARVDIECEYQPARQLVVIHVVDTGEGMNREIIDTQLTRLFSSSKEGDLTKIGKFGIGFVSVFAIRPSCVVVDTGRDGEFWRVLFSDPRKPFERIALDRPLEGTHVQVYKSATASEAEAIRKRCRETVLYWCKHSEADIFFEGERINRPFELGVPYELHHRVPGTEVAVGPSLEEEPFFGFYNRGLTLREGRAALVPGVQFKLKSRYLEHTLTRDNVRHDDNYHKAMAILKEVVDGPLRRRLFEAAAAGDDRAMGFLVHRLAELPRELAELPLFPTVDGPPLSVAGLRELARRRGEVLWDEEPTPVSEALKDRGVAVLRRAADAPGAEALIRAVIGTAPFLRATRTLARPRLARQLPDGVGELLRRVQRLLQEAEYRYRAVVGAHFAYPNSFLAGDTSLVQESPGELIRHEELDAQRRRVREKGVKRWQLFTRNKGVLLVNLDHEEVRDYFPLFQRHPALASYFLAKCVVRDDGLDETTESHLMEAALHMEEMDSAG